MASFSLPDSVLGLAQRWAERDGMSLNDWITAAVDRETVRRGLLVHSEWVKDNPIYSEEQWWAEQHDIEDAERDARYREAA